jgi:hypothetical protein
MLDQCKIKKEDFKKFIRDKAEAEILDKNKEKVRMTIRSKAAYALEIISGTTYFLNLLSLERYQNDVFATLKPHLERALQQRETWQER